MYRISSFRQNTADFIKRNYTRKDCYCRERLKVRGDNSVLGVARSRVAANNIAVGAIPRGCPPALVVTP
jgi:hypothetical protein